MTENPTEKALEREDLYDDRVEPLLLAQAATRDAAAWSYDDAEQVIAALLAQLDATRPPAGDGEAVAWMYEKSGREHKYVLIERAPYLVRDGWSETLLYAHPPATPNSGAEDGVTQGDSDAAALLIRTYWPTDEKMLALADSIQFHGHSSVFNRAFARHRLTSANTASERKKALVEALEECADTLARFTHSRSDDGKHVTARTALNKARSALSHTKEG